jgi:hypothetical protein
MARPITGKIAAKTAACAFSAQSDGKTDAKNPQIN